MKNGFTLIELLVVVLIMGILASAAVPLYFKAVERARMMEAVTLLDSISQAQTRKYMQISRYTSRAQGLDVNAATGTNAGDGNTFYTKGPQGNGFTVAACSHCFSPPRNHAQAAAQPSAQHPCCAGRPA